MPTASATGIKVNYDSGAAATAFPKSSAEDSVGNGAQYKTATGELTPDHGGVRIAGRVDGRRIHRLTGRLADVHKTLVSASKCAHLGRNGWLTKGGGYLIPDDSALSHKIKNMIQKEADRKNNELVKLYEDHGVYNMYLEMKVPGASVEVTAADGSRKPSRVHPWIDVGALARPKGAEDLQDQRLQEELRAMAREDLEKEVMKLRAAAPGFHRQPQA